MTSFRSWLALAGLLASSLLPAQTVQLRIATLAPEGTTWMKEMRAAAEAVKSGTEGRVQIRYFPGGVMGNEATVLRKIRLGQLQGGAFSAAELAGVWSEIQVYGLPFLFRDRGEVAAVRGELDPWLKSGLRERGFTALGITGGGFVYLYSTQPIGTVDQLRATKIWVPTNDTVSKVSFEQAGAQPVPLSIGDVYTALQTGLVQTVGNTPAGILAFQWQTKVKHMVDLPLAYVVGLLVVDNKAIDALSAADRSVLEREIEQAFARLDQANQRDDEQALAALPKAGIQIAALSADQAAQWRAAGAKGTAELVRQGVISAAVVQRIERILASTRAP